MTIIIFEECLYWFDTRMNGRKVVFLIDNFFAHDCAVSEMEKSLRDLKISGKIREAMDVN